LLDQFSARRPARAALHEPHQVSPGIHQHGRPAEATFAGQRSGGHRLTGLKCKRTTGTPRRHARSRDLAIGAVEQLPDTIACAPFGEASAPPDRFGDTKFCGMPSRFGTAVTSDIALAAHRFSKSPSSKHPDGDTGPFVSEFTDASSDGFGAAATVR
jgi:hypothetical protein